MLAFNLFEPLTSAMLGLLNVVHSLVPSYGWTMVLLAFCVRALLWPLANQQFKSMAEMQKVQPLAKALQAKYKGNPQELQAATMALYKEHGVNPLAGCFPLLIQLPILMGLYWAINSQLDKFRSEGWLWIGSGISHQFPAIFATSLAELDIPLFVLYVISMFISVKFGSPPSSDPQQAQTQKIMAIVSPAMIAYFGWKYHWASALIIYWLALNAFTLAQQMYMYRKYGIIGPKVTSVAVAGGTSVVDSAARQTASAKQGSTSGRSRKRNNR